VTDPASLTDDELLDAARPDGWQRALRTLGCPFITISSFLAGKAASAAVGAASWPVLGWAAGLVVFLGLVPTLMGVFSALTPRRKKELDQALRQRVGQGQLRRAVATLAEEVAELAPGQSGWILLVRAARSDGAQSVQLRLDVRSDDGETVAHLDAVRGPSLNLYSRDLHNMAAWERVSLGLDDADHWLEGLEGLDLERLGGGKGAWSLKGAVIRIGDSAQVRRFSGRVQADTAVGESPAWDVGRELLNRLGWDPSMVPFAPEIERRRT
jgi:hypothetical protein